LDLPGNYHPVADVAALFIKLPLAFAAVKFAGALYLVYLDGQSLREAARLWKARYREVPVGARTNSDSWKRYREGLLTNALNPKIAVFYFAVLPQFIKAADPVLLKLLLMAGCHYLMGALWLSGVALAAGKSRTAYPAARQGYLGNPFRLPHDRIRRARLAFARAR
jgi:threonine/homoserine/homoserine lactone efflux protein